MRPKWIVQNVTEKWQNKGTTHLEKSARSVWDRQAAMRKRELEQLHESKNLEFCNSIWGRMVLCVTETAAETLGSWKTVDMHHWFALRGKLHSREWQTRLKATKRWKIQYTKWTSPKTMQTKEQRCLKE